jgi:hypothetical protein
MTVDFSFRKMPPMRAVTRTWKGTWSDARIRSEFERLAAFAKEHHLRAGRWLFSGDDAMERWQVAIEVSGKARGMGEVRVKSFPASRVASVTFDPDEVSPRVIYHGLSDWLRWRKKEKEIRGVGGYREVYRKNPWTDRRAYAHTEIQVVVR